MAFLTYEGANAGSPNQIDMSAPADVVRAGTANVRQWEAGKQVVAQSGCLACHKIGHNGGTLGPNLSAIGARLARQAIARTLVNPTAPMPAYTSLPSKKRDDLVEFLAQLKTAE
jgi:cytochrome c551/c552